MTPEPAKHAPVGATQVAITAPGIHARAAVSAGSRLASLLRAHPRAHRLLAGAAAEANNGRDAGAAGGADTHPRFSA